MQSMTMEDVKNTASVDPATRRQVLGLANERKRLWALKREGLSEIKRINEDIRKAEQRVQAAKDEIRRIRGIISDISDSLSYITNAKIADKMELTIRQVNSITNNSKREVSRGNG